MSFDQVKHVLQQAKDFSSKTADYYAALDKIHHQAPMKMLLKYLTERDKAFSEMIDLYISDAPKGTADRWLQFTPTNRVSQNLDELKAKPIDSIDAMVEVALKIDQQLLTYLRTVGNSARKPKIRDHIFNLLNATTRKNRDLVYNVQFFQDFR